LLRLHYLQTPPSDGYICTLSYYQSVLKGSGPTLQNLIFHANVYHL
jgi:hypothetical protein